MNGQFPLNRKETFAASILVFTGLFYLLSLATAFFQTASAPAGRAFGATECKFLFLGLFYWSGAVLFFKLKNIGWIICTATLLNFILVVFRLVITASQAGTFSASAAIPVGCLILVLMGFIFLFTKETRVKFAVNNKSYLFTIGVYIILLVITLLL